MRFGTLVLAAVPLVLLGLTACVTVEHKAPGEGMGTSKLVEDEIDRRIAEIRYMSGGELLDNLYKLANIGEPALPRLRDALKSEDWLTRSSVAFVMEVMGDRRNIPYMQPLLDDSSRAVRYQVASSLVQLGDGGGFEVLVGGLADGEIAYRYKCFKTLRDATGKDFGYEHDAHPDDRRVAVTRWMDWLEELRAQAL